MTVNAECAFFVVLILVDRSSVGRSTRRVLSRRAHPSAADPTHPAPRPRDPRRCTLEALIPWRASHIHRARWSLMRLWTLHCSLQRRAVPLHVTDIR